MSECFAVVVVGDVLTLIGGDFFPPSGVQEAGTRAPEAVACMRIVCRELVHVSHADTSSSGAGGPTPTSWRFN